MPILNLFGGRSRLKAPDALVNRTVPASATAQVPDVIFIIGCLDPHCCRGRPGVEGGDVRGLGVALFEPVRVRVDRECRGAPALLNRHSPLPWLTGPGGMRAGSVALASLQNSLIAVSIGAGAGDRAGRGVLHAGNDPHATNKPQPGYPHTDPPYFVTCHAVGKSEARPRA
jgi:hypothetical protein